MARSPSWMKLKGLGTRDKEMIVEVTVNTRSLAFWLDALKQMRVTPSWAYPLVAVFVLGYLWPKQVLRSGSYDGS